MELLRGANLALAFSLELAMLAALGYFGFQIAPHPLLRWALALILPLVAATLWGFVLAPKAAHRLSLGPGILTELGLFLLTAAALYRVGQPVAALVMAVAALVHAVLAFAWGQW